uniref:acid phosphatase n=1 Tax=Dendroctonus ponderosae TaxID=77166 RepID=A0AAR5Q1L5_DENPD
MKALIITAVIDLLLGLSNGFPRRAVYENESSLVLVHVIYRHGDRNPDETSLYPTNPYYAESNYYPYGYGQLTNEGKLREYEIGTKLRQRYNTFLGRVWNTSVLEVRSTDYNRTKMSAELMAAGLWPPSCINLWNPILSWQPIPYYYEKAQNDKELSPWNACNNFNNLVDEFVETPEIARYMADRYNETMQILSERTGLEITLLKAFLLYFGFAIQEELGLPLEDWVSSIYPEPLHSLTIDFYYIQTNTTILKKIISGYLLKKILSDTEIQIDGANPQGRKMFLYSGHETNIAALLLSLDVYKLADVPGYGSFILVEVHKIDEVHGIKLFYQDYSTENPQALKLPGCDEFCPFHQFSSLVQDILPESDEECLGASKE